MMLVLDKDTFSGKNLMCHQKVQMFQGLDLEKGRSKLFIEPELLELENY